MPYIYRIKNKIDGKCYIGTTKEQDVNTRWKHHLAPSSGCIIMRDAIHKYGVDNFIFEVLIICFEEDMYIYEREYIKKYNSVSPNGYNILEGGKGGGFVGKTHTEEERKRMSDRTKLLWKNEDYRNRVVSSIRKVKKTDTKNQEKEFEKKKKLEKAEEKRMKQIDEKLKKEKAYWINNKGHKVDVKNHRKAMAECNGIKVQQYDLDNNLINTFVSMAEASRQTAISSKTIRNSVKTGCIVYKKYIWKKV